MRRKQVLTKGYNIHLTSSSEFMNGINEAVIVVGRK